MKGCALRSYTLGRRVPYDYGMSVLDRYILRQCLAIMVFVTAVLTVTVWLAQSLRLVDLIVNRGLSAEIFVYLAILILPPSECSITTPIPDGPGFP